MLVGIRRLIRGESFFCSSVDRDKIILSIWQRLWNSKIWKISVYVSTGSKFSIFLHSLLQWTTYIQFKKQNKHENIHACVCLHDPYALVWIHVSACLHERACVYECVSHQSSDKSPWWSTSGPSGGALEPQHGVITAQGHTDNVECQLKDITRHVQAPGKKGKEKPLSSTNDVKEGRLN